jgi:sigma-54-dependent transcriptional regulator
LLDEIGDMPLSLQAKLLRVLQEGEIRPLGSNLTHKIDVRIIAATHRDLKRLMSEGKFREDLYYRLAQFPIQLPPLRQRGPDIIELARHFADKACALLQRDLVHWSDAALAHLAAYDFPGNVRELKGIVERAVLLCEGDELRVEQFALHIKHRPDEGRISLRDRMEHIERSLMIDCLRKNSGNQTLTARELGLPLRTLLYRMSRLNIRRKDAEV